MRRRLRHPPVAPAGRGVFVDLSHIVLLGKEADEEQGVRAGSAVHGKGAHAVIDLQGQQGLSRGWEGRREAR